MRGLRSVIDSLSSNSSSSDSRSRSNGQKAVVVRCIVWYILDTSIEYNYLRLGFLLMVLFDLAANEWY